MTDSEARPLPKWLPALVAAALSLALYAVCIGGTYIYDDVRIARLDDRVQNPHLWKLYWTRDYFLGGVDNLYRPLVSMTYGAEWWLLGNRPWVFHLINVLLNAAAAAVVAELARRLAEFRVAMIAGVLFAVHPVHVEAVANIVGRAELLCALASVGALILFLRRPMTAGRALVIFLLFVVALLSKEQGMVLPLLILALAIATGRKSESPLERQRLLLLVLLLSWGLVGFILLREYALPLKFEWDRTALDATINPLVSSTGSDRWLMPVELLGRYTQLLVAPWKLSIDYGEAVISSKVDWNLPYVYLGFVSLAVWAGLMWMAVRRRGWVAGFCLIATAITYAPVSNLLIIGTNMNERLMYQPSIFFLILVSLGIARLPTRAAVAVVVVLGGLGALRSFTYARRWNDAMSFYATSLREQPRSIRLHLLLGQELRDSGRYDEALAVLNQAQELKPDYWMTYVRLGQVELARHRLDRAQEDFQKAFDRLPSGPLEHLVREVITSRSATQPALRDLLTTPVQPRALPEPGKSAR